ncbi:YacP-like NYN domain-containing protein [Citrus sinensis]|nr:YacP-like NYN domain-containing protein [Citrus sinensis]
MKTATLPFGGFGHSYLPSSSFKIVIVMAKSNKKSRSSSSSSKDSEPTPPRITSNVKQNLQFLRLWKEFQRSKSSTPRPSTSYRRKKVEKEELPEDTELYCDPTTTLYYTNQGIDNAVPVLLVDGYNVCGYWPKLKKHFIKGRLDVARLKLIEELVEFSMIREVKVVAVFDALMSGLPTHKEEFIGVDVVFSGETCADAWIEKEIEALREDGCPKVWVVTSDHLQQHAAYGAFPFLPSHLCAPKYDVGWCSTNGVLQEPLSGVPRHWFLRSHSFQGRLLKHNLDSEVVDALKDLRNKLSENESK